jgi:hypothetical protein
MPSRDDVPTATSSSNDPAVAVAPSSPVSSPVPCADIFDNRWRHPIRPHNTPAQYARTIRPHTSRSSHPAFHPRAAKAKRRGRRVALHRIRHRCCPFDFGSVPSTANHSHPMTSHPSVPPTSNDATTVRPLIAPAIAVAPPSQPKLSEPTAATSERDGARLCGSSSFSGVLPRA